MPCSSGCDFLFVVFSKVSGKSMASLQQIGDVMPMPRGSVLRIKSVIPTLHGAPVACLAENALGHAEATAQILVYQSEKGKRPIVKSEFNKKTNCRPLGELPWLHFYFISACLMGEGGRWEEWSTYHNYRAGLIWQFSVKQKFKFSITKKFDWGVVFFPIFWDYFKSLDF